jgi:hypothetical protein
MTFCSHSSQISSRFVTFYKIGHGWRTNSPVSKDRPIVFCLRGMNISCWSHMSDLHRKNFFSYWNIILCHFGGPYDTLVSGWPTLSMTLTIFLTQISMLDTRPILLWHFLIFVTNWPIILWHFVHIRHRSAHVLWHFIKLVMDKGPIVQSARTDLLYFAYVAWIYHVGPTCQICTEKTFFSYWNIILCHFGGPYDTLVSGWPTCQLSLGRIFFRWNSKGVWE